MSEPSEEQTEPTEPTEPEPDEDEEAETEEQTAPDEQTEPQTEEPQPEGLSDKEIEARFAKLGKENERHANRVGEILAEDANDLVPCPLCSHFIGGLVLPQMPPPEVVESVKAVLGLASSANLKHHDAYVGCSACGSEGRVLTGSKVAEYESRNCPDCQGTGYRDRAQANRPAANGDSFEPHPAFTEAAPPAPEDAAHIEQLKAQGYTVIAPIPTYSPEGV